MSGPLSPLLHNLQDRLPLEVFQSLLQRLFCFFLELLRRYQSYSLAILEYIAQFAGRESGREGYSNAVTCQYREKGYCSTVSGEFYG